MDEESTCTVEVSLPAELLYEMDRFATRHGYENQSALVARALERRE